MWWKRADFVYRDEKTGEEVSPGETRRWVVRVLTASALVGLVVKRDWVVEELPRRLRGLDLRGLLKGLMA